MYEFPSEKGDIGPFVSNEILWLKYNFCPLKSCFFDVLFFDVLFDSDVGII